MKVGLSFAVILAATASLSAQQRGVVNRVTASAAAIEVGKPVSFTASGTNPCGAVNINYGDGNVITHPITDVPATIPYTYARPGTYQVIARGMGNCDGEAVVSVRVDAAAPAAPAAAPAPAPAPAAAGTSFDPNRDGVISRAEWAWDEQSFRVHDWNRDGLLSGDEVRDARLEDEKRRAAADRAARDRAGAAAGDRRFSDLDRNRDGRITRDEWNGSRDEFEALDRNGDWVLTRAEADRAATGAAPAPALAPGAILVEANRDWTDTGLSVRAGDQLTFEATGTVRLSPDQGDVADARGSRSGRRAAGAPVRQAPAGALIARVGDGPPVDVGSRTTPVRVPRDGRLYLGVNDDHAADNDGAFQVKVTIQGSGRRR